MKNIFKALILLTFITPTTYARAGINDWKWSYEQDNYMPKAGNNPYLEPEKQVQIPQWSHEDWVAEDWISQYSDPKDIIKGFYKADILRDQIIDGDRTILIVGPNFYHLSGFDKRRVSHVIDVIYGITKTAPEAAFFLKDWKTNKYIGVHDKYGLRLN